MLKDDSDHDGGGGGAPQAVVTPPLRGGRLAVQAAVGTLAQVSQGAVGLAFLLVGHAAGIEVSTAALAVAAFGLGGAVGRPTQGNALDRTTARRVLITCGVLHVAAFELVALAAAHHSGAGFVAAGALTGLTLPPIATRQRASWPQRVSGDRAIGIFALISSLQTISLLIAPVLFTAVAVPLGYRAAMRVIAWVSGVCTVGCGLLDDGGRTATRATRVRLRRYADPLVRTAALGIVGGTVEVLAPVFAIAAHHGSAAGLLALTESVGTLVGALAARRSRRNLLAIGTGLQALGCAVLLIPMPLPLAAVALFVVGAGITPALSTLAMLISQRSGGTATSFGWQSTALTIGAAAGSALAGLLTHAVGVHAAPALGVVSALAALAVFPRLTPHHADRQ